MFTDRIISNPAATLDVYRYKLTRAEMQNHRNLRAGRDLRNDLFHIPNII